MRETDGAIGHLVAECNAPGEIHATLRVDNEPLSRCIVNLCVDLLGTPSIALRNLIPAVQTLMWNVTVAVARLEAAVIIVGGDAVDPVSIQIPLYPISPEFARAFVDAARRSGNILLTLSGSVQEDGLLYQVDVPIYLEHIDVRGDSEADLRTRLN